MFLDTDSVIFLYPKGQCPIECGDFLGDMTDEYPEHKILSYYSSGPKAYALKIRHRITGKEQYAIKVKGITLNQEVSQVISFAKFKVSFKLP